jgi:hypothetical protein
MKRVFRSVARPLGLLTVLLAFVALGAEESAPAKTFKPEELEQIVAPIALYPDSLLAQVFMASTYPLEIVEAARWSKEHPDVKGDAVPKEMEKQSWDPAVKSLVNFPDVLTMMNEKLDWTQKLGDAFLAQQKDVMDAVQRLREKAMKEGNLKSSKEQTVKTEAAPEGAATSTIVIIEPADPQVVYVPTYNPTVVYGAWPYPAYPPYYYYPPAYVPGAAFFSFSFGVMVGAGMWGGCNWGHSDIDINVNNYNKFNNINVDNTNIGNRGDGVGNRGDSVGNRGGTGVNSNNQKWQHNPDHRKGVQYRDSASQQKFGKASDRAATQSREQYRGRAEQGRQQMASEGLGNQRDLSGKPVQSREGAGNFGGQTRDSAGNLGGQSRDLGAQSRDLGSSSNRSSSPSSSRSPGAFSGSGSGSSTRAQSSRGMSSRSAGGMSRGGGRRR